MIKRIIISVFAACLLASCGTYRKYERPEIVTDGLYRQQTSGDTANIARVPWRDMFTDTCLQSLIDTALNNNTDLRVARLKVDEAQAVVQKAKLSYLPGANLNAEGSVAKFDGVTTKTYNIGLGASWELDIFGKLTAAKRGAVAALESSDAYRQAVQTGLIATVAESYYTLLMLDEQLKINLSTQENWESTVRTLDALKRGGKSNEAAVLQARANLIGLQNTAVTIRQSITETENALSSLLASASHSIARGRLEDQQFADSLSVGVPIQLLSIRPDVRQAEFNLAQAFYATNVARAAFYPSITLSGTIGWPNNGGGIVTNPGNWLLNAIGSLVQPLFNRGENIANLKIAKARQEEATLLFQQSLYDAGEEVNNALSRIQNAQTRIEGVTEQIGILKEAVRKTELLMRYSDTTYLEVLTAQQSLLQAQNTLAQDQFDKIQGIINLYHALGGGTE